MPWRSCVRRRCWSDCPSSLLNRSTQCCERTVGTRLKLRSVGVFSAGKINISLCWVEGLLQNGDDCCASPPIVPFGPLLQKRLLRRSLMSTPRRRLGGTYQISFCAQKHSLTAQPSIVGTGLVYLSQFTFSMYTIKKR